MRKRLDLTAVLLVLLTIAVGALTSHISLGNRVTAVENSGMKEASALVQFAHLETQIAGLPKSSPPPWFKERVDAIESNQMQIMAEVVGLRESFKMFREMGSTGNQKERGG